MFRDLIAQTARDWVKAKVRYQHRGTTRNGCDCTGFIIGVLRELRYLKNYKLRYYAEDWNLHRTDDFILNELGKYAIPVKNRFVKAGDIVIFHFGRSESHAGIYLGDLVFAHNYKASKHCKISSLRGSDWENRWTRSFRFDETKLSI